MPKGKKGSRVFLSALCSLCSTEFFREERRFKSLYSKEGLAFCCKGCWYQYYAMRSHESKQMTEEKFWSRVNKEPGQGPNGDCWEWTGRRNVQGYGAVTWPEAGTTKSKLTSTHRISFLICNGPLEGFQVCHTCDNPSCVNPAHLFRGTMKDNMEDKMKKGRQAKAERVAKAQLTNNQVKEIKIRRLLRESPSKIATEFQVSRNTIHKILYGVTWNSVVVTDADVELFIRSKE